MRNRKTYTVVVILAVVLMILVAVMIALITEKKAAEEATVLYDAKTNTTVFDHIDTKTPVVAYEDGIYGPVEDTGKEPVKTREKYIEVPQTDINYKLYGNVVLMIADACETGDFEELYNHLDTDFLAGVYRKYTLESFSEYLSNLGNAAGEKRKLFYNAVIYTLSDGGIVSASFIPYENRDNNIIFEYRDAIDVSFTIYPDNGDFTFLPFNIYELSAVEHFGTEPDIHY